MTSVLDWGGWSASRLGHLYPRERPGTHFTGGWVGPRAGRDGCRKSRPTGIRSPDRPARSESLYQLCYPGPFHTLYKLVKIYIGQCLLPSVIQCRQLPAALSLAMCLISCHSLTHAVFLCYFSKDCKGLVSDEIMCFCGCRHCATSWLVAGSIPGGVIGILH